MAEKLLDSGPMGKIVKTYLILIAVAGRGETITYGAVGDATGVAAINVARDLLNPLYKYLQMNQHPDLTTIVVNARAGRPGEGQQNFHERGTVYCYNWTDYAPPTVAELEAMQSEQSNDRA